MTSAIPTSEEIDEARKKLIARHFSATDAEVNLDLISAMMLLAHAEPEMMVRITDELVSGYERGTCEILDFVTTNDLSHSAGNFFLRKRALFQRIFDNFSYLASATSKLNSTPAKEAFLREFLRDEDLLPGPAFIKQNPLFHKENDVYGTLFVIEGRA